jgi:uncharacterized protein (AIM24 family)
MPAPVEKTGKFITWGVREMLVRDQLLGAPQPVLAICLEPGESVVGPTAEFAWMTDSIQLTAGQPGMSTYTAKADAGTIAFAASQPSQIVPVDITPGTAYLVHDRAFLAGTPGIEVGTAESALPTGASSGGPTLSLRRISGSGRAWVALPGDTVRHELAAGASLRANPWHIGMTDVSVTVQLAELPASAANRPGAKAHRVAVLSGPGSVWLLSLALPYTWAGPVPSPRFPSPREGGTSR